MAPPGRFAKNIITYRSFHWETLVEPYKNESNGAMLGCSNAGSFITFGLWWLWITEISNIIQCFASVQVGHLQVASCIFLQSWIVLNHSPPPSVASGYEWRGQLAATAISGEGHENMTARNGTKTYLFCNSKAFGLGHCDWHETHWNPSLSSACSVLLSHLYSQTKPIARLYGPQSTDRIWQARYHRHQDRCILCVCESGGVQADPPRFIWVQKHINHCHRLPNSFVSRYTYVTYVILKGAGLLLFLHQFLDSDRSSRSRDLNHEILWNLPIHSMTYFSEDMWTPFFLASLSSLSLVLAVLSPVLGVVLSFRGKNPPSAPVHAKPVEAGPPNQCRG